jgi:signal transduction histidine kinase
MYAFLTKNRDELIERCKAKVALRPRREATAEQLANGVPMFLEQLRRTLAAEERGDRDESLRISGASGGDAVLGSEMGVSAAAHGKKLLELGFAVDQVVHDYGDLCQAITDLAVESNAPFSVDQFRTLNRCLDNAIADAVHAFSGERDAAIALVRSSAEHESLGSFVHEVRNHLHTATLAFAALEAGTLPVGGSTGAVLKRSLRSLSALLVQALADIKRAEAGETHVRPEAFLVATFIEEAAHAATLYANASGCPFVVHPADSFLAVTGNRELLLAALANVLQNAFKFTQAHTEVTLDTRIEGDRVCIDVKDHCGGLGPQLVETMFTPFVQAGNDGRGLGLGLSIAKKSVEASGGELRVQDVPGKGCIFTIALPRQ